MTGTCRVVLYCELEGSRCRTRGGMEDARIGKIRDKGLVAGGEGRPECVDADPRLGAEVEDVDEAVGPSGRKNHCPAPQREVNRHGCQTAWPGQRLADGDGDLKNGDLKNGDLQLSVTLLRRKR
jgi:hypothetical protein